MKYPETVIQKVQNLPLCPGVYLMRDNVHKIIYVGKAVNLRNRVRSYFMASSKLTQKTKQLVSRIMDIDYYVTSSEQEALILELNLIKRHHPYYNISLRDDKTYPYLKINLSDIFPKLTITRNLKDDGSRYFGPYSDARSLRSTLKTLRHIFQLRSCKQPVDGKAKRPCLNYHIKNCCAPCIGAISQEKYGEIVKEVILFLEGKADMVVRRLKQKMKLSVERLNFEEAAHIRDQLNAIATVIEGQQIREKFGKEHDAVAFVAENDIACVQVFFVRGYKLIGRESFVLRGVQNEDYPEIMTNFVQQYYNSTTNIPSKILLQYPIVNKKMLEEWLGNKRQGAAHLEVPKRGAKRRLIDTVEANAQQAMAQLKVMEYPKKVAAALLEIQETLGMQTKPIRMEAYDISNVQGSNSVGSMVVFQDGKPKTDYYRRFKIKTVSGANDYAMLQEVIKRRFKRAKVGQEKSGNSSDWEQLPDLVLIDGGKGQLNSVIEALQEINVPKISLIGLAKENEEIFLPGKNKPLVLPKSSSGLQMLQRLRDEAHRFAVTYHRKRRSQQAFSSLLDGISGVGPKRKKNLLKHFGTVSSIRNASMSEIKSVAGISEKLAQEIKDNL